MNPSSYNLPKKVCQARFTIGIVDKKSTRKFPDIVIGENPDRKGEKMKNSLCLLLCVMVFSASGCAGREANLIQVRQFGDEQKSCEQLRSEIYYTENEISRLLPKSDKTGKNIALGAIGVFLIVPLFFIDLKQGEKKEIEAYRQRYNHLLMVTQQKDCKLPSIVVEDNSGKMVEK